MQKLQRRKERRKGNAIVPGKIRGLSSLELGVMAEELRNKIASSYFKNFYELKEGAFLLTFSKERKETAVYVNLAKTMNETEFKEKAGIPTAFALGVRKRLAGSKVEGIEQHDSDRIIVVVFSGKEKSRMVLEMFDKGNLLLVNEENLIELVYRSRSFKERSLRKGMLYSFPLARGKAPLQSNGPEDMEPRIYEKDGEHLDFAVRPMEKYEKEPGVKIQKFDTLSKLLDALYLKERETETSPEKGKEIEALKFSIEKLKRQMEEMDVRGEEYRKVAGRIFERMHEINTLISNVKQSKAKSAAEVGKEFGDIKIKALDPKKKTITIELE